ncbi:MAG: DUF4837 family protein [Bacteroidota bacterium]
MVKKILLPFIIFLSVVSCEKDKKITLVDSTGRINHLLVVMTDENWQGEVGDSLRTVLAEPLVGLPQDEAQFYVNQVTPNNFTKLFKRTRNILFIGLAEEENFYVNQNIYATPQTTLTILGEDINSLIKNIKKHKKEIIDTYKKRDLALYQNKITKKHWKINNIETFNKLDFNLKIPSTYNKIEDNGDFLWFRYPFTKGQLNILAYAVPVSSKADLNVENIIKIRDSIGKMYIPGQFENTYLFTEPLYKPVTKKIQINSKDAVETRGLWIVKNDFMGGPFLNYTVYDKAKNRLVIVEGFSYSPSTKKRDFVFELESILKTLTIK